MRVLLIVFACCLIVALAVMVSAQTFDGETPAEEVACDSLLGGTPALYGLCVAYCEAQDLNDFDSDDPDAPKQVPSRRILENYRSKMQPGEPDMPCLATPCPCWNEEELLSVTAGNHSDETSCPGRNSPATILLENDPGSTPGVQGGFQVRTQLPGPEVFQQCLTRDAPRASFSITAEEAQICFDQLVNRCAEIGHPVP